MTQNIKKSSIKLRLKMNSYLTGQVGPGSYAFPFRFAQVIDHRFLAVLCPCELVYSDGS